MLVVLLYVFDYQSDAANVARNVFDYYPSPTTGFQMQTWEFSLPTPQFDAEYNIDVPLGIGGEYPSCFCLCYSVILLFVLRCIIFFFHFCSVMDQVFTFLFGLIGSPQVPLVSLKSIDFFVYLLRSVQFFDMFTDVTIGGGGKLTIANQNSFIAVTASVILAYQGNSVVLQEVDFSITAQFLVQFADWSTPSWVEDLFGIDIQYYVCCSCCL